VSEIPCTEAECDGLRWHLDLIHAELFKLQTEVRSACVARWFREHPQKPKMQKLLERGSTADIRAALNDLGLL